MAPLSFPRPAALLSLTFALAAALAACSALPGGSQGACSGSACCSAEHLHHASLTAADLGAIGDPVPSPPPPTPTRRWSDAGAWPGGAPPAAGASVTIPAGDVVLLDVSPPPLAALVLEGDLVFDRVDLELHVGRVLVRGGLYVGSAQEPFLQRAVITLTDERAPDDGCLGSNHIALLGGTLELYGDPTGAAWTRLAETAQAGSSAIVVDDPTGWRPGDSLAIASTDFYAEQGADGARLDAQVEVRRVTAVSGDTLVLDAPLQHMHYGSAQAFAAGSGLPTTVLESRAEVARLTRNVTVQGRAETADPASPDYQFGGQVMAMGESRLRLDSVELTRMGQAGILLRYPVHWHLMGDAGAGSFVRNSSLHGLYNRCFTIHGTNGVLLEDNAAFDAFGHCYFLEDGAEAANVLRGNLALQVRKPTAANAILPTDRSHMGPAAFWITNPANELVGNVAASSEGSGFWYALPEHPTGPSYAMFDGADTWLRRTPLGAFRGNVAHSSWGDGLHVDRGPRAGSLASEATYYSPRAVPADRDSDPVLAVFDAFVAYKHRGAGAWFRGDSTVLRGALLVDNAVGVTFASSASGLEDSVLVGESANKGTPRPWETTGLDGRTLPRHWDEGFAIRGFEYYDGPVFVRNSRFEAYAPNSQRQAGAIGVLDFTSFSMSPLSYAEGLTFGPGTNRVRLETRDMAGYDPRAEDDGEDGYRSAVFRDVDGSVTGEAGAYVTVTNPLLAAPSCERRADWNANVCDGRYASLTYYDEGRTARGFAPLGLRRDADAVAHAMYGSPDGGPSTPNRHFRTVVRLGHEYSYEHAGAAPSSFSIDLGEAVPGDRLVVSVPYSGDAPFVYRDWWLDPRSLIQGYATLAQLRGGADTGYYLDEAGGRLFLLMVVQADREYARLTICRSAGC